MEKEILARAGTVIPLTAPTQDMKLPSLKMFFAGYNVHSSLVASRKVHDDMLRFAAAHDINPMIEEFKMNQAGFDEALGKLQSGSIRYRAVLVNE